MMSGDKDIENQIPEDLTQEDDLAFDGEDGHQTYADDDFGAEDFPADGDFADDAGADDFIDEDWESYDEESFIDDSESDGSEERKAAFYKLIIGSLVIFAVGVGGYVVMSSRKEENLGAPVMEKVAGVAQVNPEERVEFHSETKVQPKDSFGVTYGKQDVTIAPAPEKEARQEGLLNDPQALARLRNRESVVPAKLAAVDESDANISDNDLPMPSPMAQAETGVPQDLENSNPVPRTPTPEPVEGLIPMPERLGGEASGDQSGDALVSGATYVQDVKDVAEPAQSAAQPALAATPTTGVQSSDLARLNEKLDLITDRLGQIENNIDRLDSLQDSVSKLESRLSALEKAPASRNVSPVKQTVSKTVEKVTPSQSQSAVRPAAKPAVSRPVAESWVLKSAQPGQAMVARKGGNDMYSVTVGESLDGIGKITGIFVENGRWIVQGSGGRISQ